MRVLSICDGRFRVRARIPNGFEAMYGLVQGGRWRGLASTSGNPHRQTSSTEGRPAQPGIFETDLANVRKPVCKSGGLLAASCLFDGFATRHWPFQSSRVKVPVRVSGDVVLKSYLFRGSRLRKSLQRCSLRGSPTSPTLAFPPETACPTSGQPFSRARQRTRRLGGQILSLSGRAFSRARPHLAIS